MVTKPERQRIGSGAVLLCSLLILLFCVISPSTAEEKAGRGEDLLALINRMETMLLRPCSHVQELMQELIQYGTSYQETEKNRAYQYEEAQQQYNRKLSDFIVIKDKDGKVTPGRYLKEYLDLRKQAADAGILLEEEMPNAGLTNLAQRKDASRWFYFAELGSAGAEEKRRLRYRLDEEYQKLVERWNKSRDEFLATFEKGDFQQYNDFFEKKTTELTDLEKKSRDAKTELTNLAGTGDYEHCLGEIKVMPYTTRVVGQEGDILSGLYSPGTEGSVDGLPGMGYNLMPPKKFDPLKKPAIGDFPLGLQFKFNGNDYLKLEKDLLEIRVDAADTYVFGTSGATGRMVQYYFDTLYKTAEGLAAPVLAVKQLFTHPVDSISGIANGIAALPEKLSKITIQDINKLGNELTWGVTEKLALGKLEELKDMFAPGRFDEKPGETLQESIDRLGGKLQSLETLKAASDIESTVASIVIQVMIDGGVTKGLTAFDEIRAGMKMQAQAEALLAQAQALKKEQQLLGAAKSPQLEAQIAKLEGVAKEQLKVNQELQRFVEDFRKPPTERVPGKPLAADKLEQPLKFKDEAGNVLEVPVGKQLGKGATSEAFLNGADDGLVVRVTDLSEDSARKAAKLDSYGKNVIDNEVKSDFIRSAKTEKSMDVLDANGKKVHVEFNEKVTTAKSIIEEKGALSAGQKLSLEQATRDLNSKGFAWVDNHTGNYGFQKLPGEDRWQVVVLDTGGIYPMKGATAVEKAANARNLQTSIDKVEESMRRLGIKNEMMYSTAVRDEVYTVGGDAVKGVDIGKVGLTDVKQIGVGAGVDMRPASELFKKGEGELLKDIAANDMKALNSDPAYSSLKQKYSEGKKELEGLMKSAGSEVDTAAKKVAEGPKAPPSTGKSTGLDPELTAKELLATQLVAEGFNKETCAAYRKALLDGVVAESVKKMVQDCVQRGL